MVRYDDGYFKAFTSLYEEGLKYEKNGEPDRAIEIYLHILHRYRPWGTSYYERPAILLERAHRYEEALWVCGKAMENADLGVFNTGTGEAVRADCSKRLERLKRKIETERSGRRG